MKRSALRKSSEARIIKGEEFNIFNLNLTGIFIEEYSMATNKTKKEIKLAVFDIDGTIVRSKNGSSIFRLLDSRKGLGKEAQELREKYKDNLDEARLLEWSIKSFELYQKHRVTQDDILELAISHLKPALGLKKMINYLHKNGIKIAVVSGSIKNAFDIFAEANNIKIDYEFISNHYIFDKNGRLVDKEIHNYNFSGKVKAISEICKNEGISLDNVLFIGDGVNDKDALREVGLGIAFNTDDVEVIESANVHVKGKSFSSILKLLEEMIEQD